MCRKFSRKRSGLTYKIIGGYKGKQELELAIERGELDGTTLGYASLASRHEDWIQKGSVRPMILIRAHRPAAGIGGRSDRP